MLRREPVDHQLSKPTIHWPVERLLLGVQRTSIAQLEVFRFWTRNRHGSLARQRGPSFLECLAAQSHDRLPQGQGRVLTKDHGAKAMATQIVMDHTGDTRHYFNSHDREAVAKAEERFRKLTGAGFTAAVRTATGDAAITRSFDPTAEETLFFPRLVGG